MRVLQVSWEYPPRLFGGLGRHVEGLVGALADGGADVTVLTPEGDGDGTHPRPGVRLLRGAAPGVALPEDRWVATVLEANTAMAVRASHAGVVADVLHVHDWMAGHAARLLAPLLGLPVVATIHATERGRHMGFLPPGISGWIDAQERMLVDLADRVVVCSSAMAEQATRWLGAQDVTVIPNGVDPARWAVEVTREPTTVVFAGRLEHEKGLQILLEATRGMAVHVVVAGTGSRAEALRRAAHPRVRFVGHLDQPALAGLLARATVAVVPSLYEPFGLAALEAMAAGTPVVASEVGGLPEVVGDAGVLVPPDDAPALRRALRRLLADPDQRAGLRRRGQARAASLSWSAAGTAHRQLYTDLVDGTG